MTSNALTQEYTREQLPWEEASPTPPHPTPPSSSFLGSLSPYPDFQPPFPIPTPQLELQPQTEDAAGSGLSWGFLSRHQGQTSRVHPGALSSALIDLWLLSQLGLWGPGRRSTRG